MHILQTIQLAFLTEENGKEVLHLTKTRDSSGTQMDPRQMKALELGWMAMAQGKGLALA
jgi:hypothetical protein